MSKTVPPRDTRFLAWIGLTAFVGFGLFGFLAWRSITVEEIELEAARGRFTEIRDRLPRTEPVLHIDEKGAVTRRVPAASQAPRATRLHVLAYVSAAGRLASADAPFWFLKMKGPTVKYAFRGTGFDLDRLGVTPADLEKYGVCLVLDETRRNGDRLLVWTE
jgi:hypothetical protein